ncbi:hypothetical protein [Bacteroidetes bacterium endosymbiont of Geopemphigus sp.]|uniref:hypothetical protein n=1 Tax=Bacteroidetes bacterium endosymbiont of Geopemphigus sp. TaxID=2047937 RepID=UPI000CD2095F|nr:hypothetical protein [Bacteroidetes bacterium endosymbiont of Geopemphigus sp.]
MIHKSVMYSFMLALYHVLKNYRLGGDHPFELDLPSRYLTMVIVAQRVLFGDGELSGGGLSGCPDDL